MPDITITVSAAFVAAVQTEAGIDGVGAQAWAKQAVKDKIVARRLERKAQEQEPIRLASLSTAQTAAQAAYDVAIATETAAVGGLN